MQLTRHLRHLAIDLLGQRDDRCYWRQACEPRALPRSARVLLWQPDGKLGDGLLNASFVHDLRVQRPDVQVHVACPPGMQAFWKPLPGVHAVHSTESGAARKALVAASQGCDAFVSFETFLSLDTVRLVRALKPARTLGFSVSRYRLFTDALVDTTYEFPREPIQQRLVRLCDVLAVQHLGRSDVADCLRNMPRAADIGQHPGLAVFFNTYAANADRCLSPQAVVQVRSVIRSQLSGAAVTLSLPSTQSQATALDANTQALPPCASVWALMQHIDACDVVISPDTAIGHLGAALGKHVIVIYRDRHYNPVVWRPQGPSVQVLLPQQPGDINSFLPGDLLSAIDSIKPSLPS
nr:glycosyltransferase family 9 protein [uncultured Aquabacterium sp.]